MKYSVLCTVLVLSAVPSVLLSQDIASLPDPPRVRREQQRSRFFPSFQPFTTPNAALSPDGKYLGFTLHKNGVVSLVVIDLDNPQKVLSCIPVISDDQAAEMLADNIYEKTPGAVRWLKWVTPTRLVAETNRNIAVRRQPPPTPEQKTFMNLSGEVVAIDATGSKVHTLLSPNDILLDVFQNDSGSLKDLFRDQNSRLSRTIDPIGRTADMPLDEMLYHTADLIMKEAFPAPSVFAIPTAPRIFDIDPENQGSIIVHCGTQENFHVLRLDVQSGKTTPVSKEHGADTMATLLDRQSRGRAVVPNTITRPFPHHYAVDRRGFSWTKLNKILPQKAAAPFVLSPETYFGRRSFPVGFDEDPNILYFASNDNRDTYGIYALDIKTKHQTSFAIENPSFDMAEPSPEGFDSKPLIFDRFTRLLFGIRYGHQTTTTLWLRPEWEKAQEILEKSLPGYLVEILEWDQHAKRFLVLASAPSDPGAFYIFEPATTHLTEIVRRAPRIDKSRVHRSQNFSLNLPDGVTLSGIVTLPRKVRLKPTPIVVLCPPEPWNRTTGEFNNEIHALAEMGFAVVQLNPRGTSGFGRKHRDAAILAPEGFESAQTQDIISAIDHLAQRHQLSSKHVALMGALRGGYLALRALQLHPERFRCVITFDATVDLQGWLSENHWSNRHAAPVLVRSFFGEIKRFHSPLRDEPQKITRPALFLSYPGLDGDQRSLPFIAAKKLHFDIRNHGGISKFIDLPQDYVRHLPQARSEAFAQIEDFLNEHIYSYNVKLGETEVKDDDVKTDTPKK